MTCRTLTGMTYPPAEVTSYDLQRLDFTVVALGAALIAFIILKYLWNKEKK